MVTPGNMQHEYPPKVIINDGMPKCFGRIKPLVSKIARKCGKGLAYTALAAGIAIGGANLGTYFDYKYNNYDYRRLENRTTLDVGGVPRSRIIEKALEAARLRLVGAKPPEEARLRLELSAGSRGVTALDADYIMVWSTNKGIEHRDEEEVRMRWEYSDSLDRFVPLSASTRYHYRWVEMNLRGEDEPVIVIQNPAHTPGIPGTVPRYTGGAPGIVDVFTLFAAEKWAGSCLSSGLPQRFGPMEVRFSTEIVERP